MKLRTKILAGVVAVVILFCGFSYMKWSIGRKLTYTVSYKSMVEQTVKDMVKAESLKK